MAGVGAERLEPVRGRLQRHAIGGDDDVAGIESCIAGGAFVLNGADEQAVASAHAEVLGELGGDWLDLRADIGLRIGSVAVRGGSIAVGVAARRDEGLHPGLGDGDMEVVGPGMLNERFAIGELDAVSLHLGVVNDVDLDDPADGHVAEHAGEGCGVGDELPVDGPDDVTGMDPGLGCGRIVVERDNFSADGAGKLLFLRTGGVDIMNCYAKITLRRGGEDEARVAVHHGLGKLRGDRGWCENGLHRAVGGQRQHAAAKPQSPTLPKRILPNR